VGRNLKQKLRGELRGILNWAVNGLSRLQDNNWKMTEAQGFQAGMASIREYTDVVKGFLEENYEFIGEITLDSSGKFQKENNDYVESRDLMANYQLYCASNNFQRLNGKKFQQELARFKCIKKQKQIGKEHWGWKEPGDCCLRPQSIGRDNVC
jgi:putative DNA primase/helicase